MEVLIKLRMLLIVWRYQLLNLIFFTIFVVAILNKIEYTSVVTLNYNIDFKIIKENYTCLRFLQFTIFKKYCSHKNKTGHAAPRRPPHRPRPGRRGWQQWKCCQNKWPQYCCQRVSCGHPSRPIIFYIKKLFEIFCQLAVIFVIEFDNKYV